jgi:hypothetical protein
MEILVFHLTTQSLNKRFAAEAGAAMITVAFATGVKAEARLSSRGHDELTWIATTTILSGDQVAMMVLGSVIMDYLNANEGSTVEECIRYVAGRASTDEAQFRLDVIAQVISILVQYECVYQWAVASLISGGDVSTDLAAEIAPMAVIC